MKNLINVGWMFLMQILVYPIQLLIIPYLIHNLGVDSYGSYVVYLAIVGVLMPFIDFGTSISLQVGFLHLDREGKQQLISELIGFKLSIVLVIIIVISLLILIFDSFSWSIFGLFGWVIYAIYSSDFYFLAELKNKNLFLRQFYQKCSFFSVVFLLLFLFNAVETVLLSLSVSYLIVTVYTIKDISRDGYHVFPIFSTKSIRNILKNNLLYFANNFATVGYNSINTYFIQTSLGSMAIGRFSILESVNRACLSLITSVNSVLFPLLSKETNKKLFLKFLMIVPAYLIIAAVIYLNRKYIFLFFKIDRIEDSTVLIMLTVLCLDALSRFLGYNFLGAIGKGNIVNVTNLIGLASYVPVYFILKLNVIWEKDFNLFATTYLISIIIVLSMRVYYNIKYFKKI
tara:strand:- start:111 stop:1310 length:1200 start_codon:yes stop_codon:yes gene_type:complete